MLRNVIQGLEPTSPDLATAKLAERRQMVRVRCYCRVEITDREGQTLKGTVTDIGVDGMRLRCREPLLPETVVTISYPGAEPASDMGSVRCHVVWLQTSRNLCVAGVRYHDTTENRKRSWVMKLLQELGFDESRTYQRRKHIRAEGMIPARVQQEGDVADAHVVNLGLGGALVEGTEPVEPGRPIHLSMCLWRILPTLTLQGQVLDSRAESSTGVYLHSIQFAELRPEQVRLLGSYVIHLINQTAIR